MHVRKLSWLGTRTPASKETFAFFSTVLGLPLAHLRHDLWIMQLPDGSKVEVFGPDHPHNRHMEQVPVAGFLVDDTRAAAAELRAAGAEVVHGPQAFPEGYWLHFRAPDGHLYELTQDSSITRPG